MAKLRCSLQTVRALSTGTSRYSRTAVRGQISLPLNLLCALLSFFQRCSSQSWRYHYHQQAVQCFPKQLHAIGATDLSAAVWGTVPPVCPRVKTVYVLPTPTAPDSMRSALLGERLPVLLEIKAAAVANRGTWNMGVEQPAHLCRGLLARLLSP